MQVLCLPDVPAGMASERTRLISSNSSTMRSEDSWIFCIIWATCMSRACSFIVQCRLRPD